MRDDDERALILGLYLQATVLEQCLKCFLGCEPPLHRRRVSACTKIAGEDDLYRRLLCERVDGIAQRCAREIHVHLFPALGRHCDEQATGKQ
ncbi:hypothetical protein PPS11_03465 [Pseudomonas putida S11]|nr:hypothetical protein PPS11_03465 [Pseudomonas putida S11]